jgi:hypothetical protein
MMKKILSEKEYRLGMGALQGAFHPFQLGSGHVIRMSGIEDRGKAIQINMPPEQENYIGGVGVSGLMRLDSFERLISTLMDR